ncbi:MAG TPA: hypothetical protein PKV86_11250 [Syntrophobacteraceae bacterium]|nr:hypothetical protein [Syntrophobacteraceae bacterium]
MIRLACDLLDITGLAAKTAARARIRGLLPSKPQRATRKINRHPHPAGKARFQDGFSLHHRLLPHRRRVLIGRSSARNKPDKFREV